jgi:hypothetical protein
MSLVETFTLRKLTWEKSASRTVQELAKRWSSPLREGVALLLGQVEHDVKSGSDVVTITTLRELPVRVDQIELAANKAAHVVNGLASHPDDRTIVVGWMTMVESEGVTTTVTQMHSKLFGRAPAILVMMNPATHDATSYDVSERGFVELSRRPYDDRPVGPQGPRAKRPKGTLPKLALPKSGPPKRPPPASARPDPLMLAVVVLLACAGILLGIMLLSAGLG